MNDDLVQPNRGFGTHGHGNMEIATYIVHGSLTHNDSMGTAETLGRGAVQFMTAGTGISHSEHNLDKTTPLRFIQMWITPRRKNLPPNYGSFTSDESDRKNRFFHLVGDVADASAATPMIRVNQDVNIHVAEIEPGTTVSYQVAADRQAYVLCVEGDAVGVSTGDGAATSSLGQYDAAEVHGNVTLSFTPTSATGHILVVEMAEAGSARGDI